MFGAVKDRLRAHFFPKIDDPTNVDSEIGPGDYQVPTLPKGETEEAIVRLVQKRAKQCEQAKTRLTREWVICQAMRRGQQYVEWAGTVLRSLINPNDRHRNCVPVNYIRPLVLKIKNRLTITSPDVIIAPLTDAPRDRMAAEDLRDSIAHYDRKFDRRAQTAAIIDSAVVTSTTRLKITWDPLKMAYTQAMGPDGQMRSFKAPIGDLDECIVPPDEALPDPRARREQEMRWFIHAKWRPLSYLQEKFGERGYTVDAETSMPAAYTSVNAYADTPMEETTALLEEGAMLYEMWELPSARYPKGRVAWVAGNVLLAWHSWPYDKNDELPFVPYGYQYETGSLWAANAVSDLVPIQRKFNDIVSRISDRINNDKPALIVPRGAEIGSDAYVNIPGHSPSAVMKVYVTPGLEPNWQPAPPISQYWFGMLEFLRGAMEDLTAVHEPSQGQAPAGVTAASAIHLLQQSDNMQAAEASANLESFYVKRIEWEGALLAQFVKEGRLMEIGTDSDPDKARAKAVAFKGLREGGLCRVTVKPGSATPKTPAAHNELLLSMYEKGMFAPDVLPITVRIIDLMNIDQPDVMRERLLEALQEIMQQAPDPAALEQGKMAMAQQMAELEQQHQIALEQARAQVAMEREEKLAEIKALMSQLEHQMDREDAEHEAVIGLQTEAARRELPPYVDKISVSADPAATVDIEAAAGYQGEEPPVPQPGPGGPPNERVK